MKIEQIKERLKKAEEKLAKLNASLDKRNKQKAKILLNYKMNKDLCAIIPYEVFDNFEYISWRDQQNGKKNNETFHVMYSEYVKTHNYWDTIAQDLYDFEHKMIDVIERIHNDEEEKAIVKENIEKLHNDLNNANDTQSDVDKLFAKVPELKTFLDTCAEKQYEFQIAYNEKLKKEWEAYYKEDKKLSAQYNARQLPDGRDYREAGLTYGDFNRQHTERWREVEKMKPKRPVMPESMIKTMIEGWKVSESWLMADRIKTEFGEVISTQLRLGDDGNVNGIIRGTLRSAKLETIWAGGYNIQKLHTRLLFHEF